MMSRKIRGEYMDVENEEPPSSMDNAGDHRYRNFESFMAVGFLRSTKVGRQGLLPLLALDVWNNTPQCNKLRNVLVGLLAYL